MPRTPLSIPRGFYSRWRRIKQRFWLGLSSSPAALWYLARSRYHSSFLVWAGARLFQRQQRSRIRRGCWAVVGFSSKTAAGEFDYLVNELRQRCGRDIPILSPYHTHPFGYLSALDWWNAYLSLRNSEHSRHDSLLELGWRRFLDQTNPTVLFVANEPRSRTLYQWAQMHHCPVVALSIPQIAALFQNPELAEQAHATVSLVSSDHWLNSTGQWRAKTFFPILDPHRSQSIQREFEEALAKRDEHRARWGVRENQRLVLVALQARREDAELVDACRSAMEDRSDTRWVIRPHPLQRLPSVRYAFPDLLVSREFDALTAVMTSDVVVSGYSTLLLYARFVAIPSIAYLGPRQGKPTGFVPGSIAVVQSPEALKRQLACLLDSTHSSIRKVHQDFAATESQSRTALEALVHFLAGLTVHPSV